MSSRTGFSIQTYITFGAVALLSLPVAIIFMPKDAALRANSGSTRMGVVSGTDAPEESTEVPTMILNNESLEFHLGKPYARRDEVEADGETRSYITIVFPCQWPNASSGPGLQITFYPDAVSAGRSMNFEGSSSSNPIRVTYYPDPVETWRDNGNLAYTNWMTKSLGGRILFTVIDASDGGHICGTLMNARLEGVYTDPAMTMAGDPGGIMDLELRDFRFDAIVGGEPFAAAPASPVVEDTEQYSHTDDGDDEPFEGDPNVVEGPAELLPPGQE